MDLGAGPTGNAAKTASTGKAAAAAKQALDIAIFLKKIRDARHYSSGRRRRISALSRGHAGQDGYPARKGRGEGAARRGGFCYPAPHPFDGGMPMSKFATVGFALLLA